MYNRDDGVTEKQDETIQKQVWQARRDSSTCKIFDPTVGPTGPILVNCSPAEWWSVARSSCMPYHVNPWCNVM